MQSNNLPIGQANGNVINMKKLFKKLFKLNDIQNVLYFIGKCFEARMKIGIRTSYLLRVRAKIRGV